MGLKPFQVLHADLLLPIEERLLWPSQLTLLDSALLYDYVQLFRVLEPNIFESSPYRHLLGVFPRRKQLDEWNVWTLVDGGEGKLLRTSIEERIRRRHAGTPKVGEQPPPFNYVPSFFIPTAQCFQTLGRTIADKLAFRTLGIHTSSAIATKTESEINFDLLAMQMREGIFDFCGEPYFLSGARTQFAAVVQFGWLHTFECVVHRETSVWRTLQAYRGPSNVDPVLAAVFKGDAAKTIEIGLLGESAATSEVAPHVTSYIHGDQLTMEPNHQQLAKWLVNAPEGKQRLVICDHGVAERIREDLERTYGRRGEYTEAAECPRLQYSENTVAAPRGIPVGYLYPREDPSWRRQISLAFAESIDVMGQDGWSTVQDELRSVHLEPFTYEDVRSYLLMDMTIDEALARERHHHQTIATST